jgi:amphi-Trp domain-containing protein
VTEEEVLFKTEEEVDRTGIADRLRDAAEQIESGNVELKSSDQQQTADVPETSTFEVELERQTDADSSDYYELEFELSWNE